MAKETKKTDTPSDSDVMSNMLAGPAEDARPESQKKHERDKADWDKNRQESDQKHATERKETQGKLDEALGAKNTAEAQTTDLANKLADLQKRLDAATAKAGETRVVDKDDEFLDPDDKTARQLGLMQKSIDALAAQGANVVAMKEQLDDMSKGFQRIVDGNDLEDFLGAMDGQYGADRRNEAVASAKRHFAEAGYTEASPPSNEEMKSRVELAYLKQGAPIEKGTVESEDDVAIDSGTGGALLDPNQQFQTVEEIAEDIKASGKADGLKWPDD